MKKKVKLILLAITAVFIVLIGAWYTTRPIQLDVVRIEPSEGILYFTEQGLVEDRKTVEIYPTVEGRLISVLVEENQHVQAGDVICIIDTAAFEYEIAQLEESIAGNKAQIANLELEEQKQNDSLRANRDSLLAEYNALAAQEKTDSISRQDSIKVKEEQARLQNILITQSEKELQLARENYEKGRLLYQSGIISKNEVDELENAVNKALALKDSYVQELAVLQNSPISDNEAYYEAMKDSLQSQIAGIDRNLSTSYTAAMKTYYNSLIEAGNISIDQMEQKIKDAHIVTPVSGTVSQLNADGTNIAGLQAPVAVIKTEGEQMVTVFVSTNDIDEVYLGQKVDLTVKRQKEDRQYTGAVAAIEGEAVLKMSSLGIEERRVKVSVEMDAEAKDKLLPGYDVDVRFTTYKDENCLMAPKTAVFKIEGKDMVWVIEDGVLALRAIGKGLELRTAYVVEDGLLPGDIVVRDANQEKLKKGVKVALHE